MEVLYFWLFDLAFGALVLLHEDVLDAGLAELGVALFALAGFFEDAFADVAAEGVFHVFAFDASFFHLFD